MEPKSDKKVPEWVKRLVAARTLTGMSASQFAKAIGTYQQRYAQYEIGRAEPPFSLLVKIRARTGVSLDFIIAGIPPASPLSAAILPFDSQQDGTE